MGLIGGSGVYDLEAIEGLREENLETPFGPPSDSYFTGTLSGVPVAFLSRHGRGHSLSPSEINYRANVWGFKTLGCDALLSASAVGSLREEDAPRRAVIPDQFIDRTRHRPDTFFGDGLVAHVSFAEPVCPSLARALEEAADAANLPARRGATYVCMEGPQFSTRAESLLYRSWGADVVGMTNLTEAKLAREAEICYALVALPTDYDCWKPHPGTLDQAKVIEEILGNVKAATQNAIELIRRAIPRIAELGDKPCPCQSALALAIWSDRSRIAPAVKERLRPILSKYLP